MPLGGRGLVYAHVDDEFEAAVGVYLILLFTVWSSECR